MSHPTTALVYNPDLKKQAVANLLFIFKDKPRMVALVESLAQGAQLMEDTNFDLLIGTTLGLSTGRNLDLWGELVVEARGSLNDRWYRGFITGRIQALQASGSRRTFGKTDRFIRVYKIITQALAVRHVNLFPAGFALTAFVEDPLPIEVRNRARQLMLGIKPAGISMDLEVASLGYFGFAEDPAALPFDVGVFAGAL